MGSKEVELGANYSIDMESIEHYLNPAHASRGRPAQRDLSSARPFVMFDQPTYRIFVAAICLSRPMGVFGGHKHSKFSIITIKQMGVVTPTLKLLVGRGSLSCTRLISRSS